MNNSDKFLSHKDAIEDSAMLLSWTWEKIVGFKKDIESAISSGMRRGDGLGSSVDGPSHKVLSLIKAHAVAGEFEEAKKMIDWICHSNYVVFSYMEIIKEQVLAGKSEDVESIISEGLESSMYESLGTQHFGIFNPYVVALIRREVAKLQARLGNIEDATNMIEPVQSCVDPKYKTTVSTIPISVQIILSQLRSSGLTPDLEAQISSLKIDRFSERDWVMIYTEMAKAEIKVGHIDNALAIAAKIKDAQGRNAFWAYIEIEKAIGARDFPLTKEILTHEESRFFVMKDGVGTWNRYDYFEIVLGGYLKIMKLQAETNQFQKAYKTIDEMTTLIINQSSNTQLCWKIIFYSELLNIPLANNDSTLLMDNLIILKKELCDVVYGKQKYSDGRFAHAYARDDCYIIGGLLKIIETEGNGDFGLVKELLQQYEPDRDRELYDSSWIKIALAEARFGNHKNARKTINIIKNSSWIRDTMAYFDVIKEILQAGQFEMLKEIIEKMLSQSRQQIGDSSILNLLVEVYILLHNTQKTGKLAIQYEDVLLTCLADYTPRKTQYEMNSFGRRINKSGPLKDDLII